MGVDVLEVCDQIINPSMPQALRLQTVLMGGVAMIHAKQVAYLLSDCNDAMMQLATSEAVRGATDTIRSRQRRSKSAAEPEACSGVDARIIGHASSNSVISASAPFALSLDGQVGGLFAGLEELEEGEERALLGRRGAVTSSDLFLVEGSESRAGAVAGEGLNGDEAVSRLEGQASVVLDDLLVEGFGDGLELDDLRPPGLNVGWEIGSGGAGWGGRAPGGASDEELGGGRRASMTRRGACALGRPGRRRARPHVLPTIDGALELAGFAPSQGWGQSQGWGGAAAFRRQAQRQPAPLPHVPMLSVPLPPGSPLVALREVALAAGRRDTATKRQQLRAIESARRHEGRRARECLPARDDGSPRGIDPVPFGDGPREHGNSQGSLGGSPSSASGRFSMAGRALGSEMELETERLRAVLAISPGDATALESPLGGEGVGGSKRRRLSPLDCLPAAPASPTLNTSEGEEETGSPVLGLPDLLPSLGEEGSVGAGYFGVTDAPGAEDDRTSPGTLPSLREETQGNTPASLGSPHGGSPSRVVTVASLLRERIAASPTLSASFRELAAGLYRGEVAKLFYQALVLKAAGAFSVEQAEPYADLVFRPVGSADRRRRSLSPAPR